MKLPSFVFVVVLTVLSTASSSAFFNSGGISNLSEFDLRTRGTHEFQVNGSRLSAPKYLRISSFPRKEDERDPIDGSVIRVSVISNGHVVKERLFVDANPKFLSTGKYRLSLGNVPKMRNYTVRVTVLEPVTRGFLKAQVVTVGGMR